MKGISPATIKIAIDPAVLNEQGDSDFEIISKNEVATEGVILMTSSDLLSDQAKEHNKVINACALRLAGHDQTNPTCAGDHKCDACYDFIEGLELLANCAAEWIYPHRSFKDMSAAVLHKLRSLSEYQQRAFNVLLTKLLGDANWAESDYDVVTDGDFEISAVVWALKLGPRGLAAGWEAGKSTLAILMDEEEAWILANIAHVKYNDKKQILEDYADAICGWALDLQRTVADGDE